MGLRIHTNMQSMTAQRTLHERNDALRSVDEKLASGSRINRAADDAAGLAVSEKMRGQERSLRQGIRNASDGIGMLQTAEGAMTEISSIFVRFRELAIQGASDTLGDTERGYLQKEVAQLKSEVTRIIGATDYNGIKLLGSGADVREIQIGLNNDPDADRLYYDVLQSNISPAKLGLDSISVGTKEDARGSLNSIDSGIQHVSRSRAIVGALQNRLQSAIQNGQIYDENLAGAKSRISDTDLAQATAERAKEQLLVTAGTSLLAQANTSALLALKLLG